MVRVTALMDDHASEHKALTAEHGLSYLVEMPELRLLFDCGASAVPMANAHRLGLSLKELDAVVLSIVIHPHYISVFASRINATSPSPRIVAPLISLFPLIYLPKDLITISCCPIRSSTTSPT